MSCKHADDTPTASPTTVAAIVHTKPTSALLREILATQIKQSPVFNDKTVLVADVAAKCNPAPVILETLVHAGAGFDVASAWELDQVLAMGADLAKPVSHLRHAAAMGVWLLTFDSVFELRKIHAHHPNPLLVLRMAIGAGHARSASTQSTAGCIDARAYTEAVVKARSVLTMAAELGFNMTLLDVGGGDGRHGSTFADIATTLHDAIAPEFAMLPVCVIAERGRYFVAHAYHVALNVIGHRMRDAPTPDAPPRQHLRFHEGAYTLFERGNHPRRPDVIVKDGEMMADPHKYVGNSHVFPTTCYGPTCAAMDLVVESRMLPDVQPGDWPL
ncbi:hypothetical protein GGF32_006400 [Allomyces javanicus]|nr:hypothetical protein GGF32_006400 [Allomyces javanicus]